MADMYTDSLHDFYWVCHIYRDSLASPPFLKYEVSNTQVFTDSKERGKMFD